MAKKKRTIISDVQKRELLALEKEDPSAFDDAVEDLIPSENTLSSGVYIVCNFKKLNAKQILNSPLDDVHSIAPYSGGRGGDETLFFTGDIVMKDKRDYETSMVGGRPIHKKLPKKAGGCTLIIALDDD